MKTNTMQFSMNPLVPPVGPWTVAGDLAVTGSISNPGFSVTAAGVGTFLGTLTVGGDIALQSGGLFVGSGGEQLYLRSLGGTNRIDSYDNPITVTVPLQLNAASYAFQIADATKMTLDSAGILTVTESGTGGGLGGLVSATATAGGNAGVRLVTGGSDRWSMSLVGAADAESVRWYKSGTGAGTAMSLTASGVLLVEGLVGTPWAPTTNGIALSVDGTGRYVTSYFDDTSITFGTGVTQKTGITVYGQTHASGNKIVHRVGNATRMTLDASGNLLLENTASAPSTPTGGALYVESGALKYRGSGGTVTTVAPA